MTRRLLMIAYYFPPIIAAGSQRSAAFAALLPKFGWEPRVLTVARSRMSWEAQGGEVPANVDVVRSCEWNLQRVVALASAVIGKAMRLLGRNPPASLYYDLCVPDTQMAWFTTLPGLWYGRDCSCAYASCSPFSSALSGCAIKLIAGTPLVLDFRDAWWLNPHKRMSAPADAVVRRLESWVLRRCDALIVNSPGAARLYQQTYAEHAHKIVSIPNGFDRLAPCAPPSSSGPFRIMHVGDFYRSRSPHDLFQELAALQLPDVEFIQVGNRIDQASPYSGMTIRCVDKVPHREALELMRTASLLYLKQGHESGLVHDVAIASKTYEYLATGLPILAECPPGDNADVIRQYGSRAYVVTSGSREELRAAIRRAYDERSQPAGITPHFEAAFDRVELTRRLAEIIDRVASAHQRNAISPDAQRVCARPGQRDASQL